MEHRQNFFIGQPHSFGAAPIIWVGYLCNNTVRTQDLYTKMIANLIVYKKMTFQEGTLQKFLSLNLQHIERYRR